MRMTESVHAGDATTEYLQTPSQTIGPFFGFGLEYDDSALLVPGHHPSAIRLHGTLFDGAGKPVPDGLVEIWQADEHGILPQRQGSFDRDGYTFTGFGRDLTTRAGTFSFTTLKPGPVDGSAPYVLVTVFARGLTHHLTTRAYFDDEDDLNAGDTLLRAVAPSRRSTLIATSDAERSYCFDIHLQGASETVFLDFQ
jgi:protocatechuate 3,4-dioxygenase alpha subunit